MNKTIKFETIKYERVEGILTITINRPEVLNSLNLQMLKELSTAIDLASADEEIELIIFTGEGRAFIVGADIEEMRSQNQLESNEFSAYGAAVMRKIEKLAKPTIAALNGFTLGGGCELAMSCDMRIASEKAKFGQPEVGLGIMPGFSGTQRLPRLIGKAKAIELILTGEIINAETALALGLVNKVVAPENLIPEAMSLAAKIMKNGPRAVRYANLAIKRGYDTDIETAINIETSFFSLCFATEDQKEGMGAFIEKRKPNFQGK